MGEVFLYVDVLKPSSYEFSCRICHEEEGESLKSMEAPCACSGTVKFAHRDCIQRWCNEKGNTTCEICLQEYRPGYTAPSKKSQLIEAASNVVGSLEESRREGERRRRRRRTRRLLMRREGEVSECNSAANRGVSCCRPLALTLTVVLLIKHSLEVLTGATGDYPFTLLTVIILKASGIMLPMLLLLRTISIIHTHLQQPPSDFEHDTLGSSDDDEETHDQQQLHIV